MTRRNRLEVRTDRLVLRPLSSARARTIVDGGREADWAPDYPTAGDVVVAGLVSGRQDLPGVWGPWEVRTRPDGLLVGGAGFHGPPVDGAVEVGYGLAASWRGRGLAREAVAGLLDLARSEGVDRVIAHVDRQNLASVRLLAALGFEAQGSLRLQPTADVPAGGAGPAPAGQLRLVLDLA